MVHIGCLPSVDVAEQWYYYWVDKTFQHVVIIPLQMKFIDITTIQNRWFWYLSAPWKYCFYCPWPGWLTLWRWKRPETLYSQPQKKIKAVPCFNHYHLTLWISRSEVKSSGDKRWIIIIVNSWGSPGSTPKSRKDKPLSSRKAFSLCYYVFRFKFLVNSGSGGSH